MQHMPPLPRPTADLIERARAFASSDELPAVPKPSATVILLRDNAAELEVFVLRRVSAMVFAGGRYVFPGGVVDPSDETPAITAIRETFEESGVLLATGPSVDLAELEIARLALVEHRTTLATVLAEHGLTARLEALRLWSRWITPHFEPRRYDTGFFVAVAPDDQIARAVSGESDDATWTTPRAALRAAAAGEWLLMPPTEATLRELLPYRTAAEAFASAENRKPPARQVGIDLDADPPRLVYGEQA